MKKCIFITMVILFSNNSFSTEMNYYDSIDKLKSLDGKTCESISESDGYLGFVSCTEKMYQKSEFLLNKKLSVYIKEIEKLNDHNILVAFDKYQKEWLNYRAAKCAFITSSTIKGSEAYNSMHQLCYLNENYNRINFLSSPPPSS